MSSGRIADPQPVRRRRRIEAEATAGGSPSGTGERTEVGDSGRTDAGRTDVDRTDGVRTGEYPVTTPAASNRARSTAATADSRETTDAAASGAKATRDRTPKPGSLRSLAVSPDITGPRVRLGVLWFLLAMAAATAGRTWSAAFWALVAGTAALEIVATWHPHHRLAVDGSEGPVVGSRLPELVAFLFAASVPVAAGWGTGTGGAVLIAVSLVSLVVALVFRLRAAAGSPPRRGHPPGDRRWRGRHASSAPGCGPGSS